MRLHGDVIRTIAVFRALQLGDMLCSVPALRALRDAYPAAKITLIGLPWAASFSARFSHLVDDFIPFPGFPGLPEQQWCTDSLIGFLEGVRARQFDLVLQMHGSGLITNPLICLFGSEAVAGCYAPPAYVADEETFVPYPESGHEIERQLALIRHLGIQPQGEHLEFPIHAHEAAAYQELATALELKPRCYVCVHPGGRKAERLWEATRFAEVADHLATQGFKVILTGNEEERPLVESVRKAMRQPCLDLAGKTGVGVLAELLRNTALLFSNDTGVSHLAAAVGAPSVVVFTASDPHRWAPLDSQLHRVISPEESDDISHVREVAAQHCNWRQRQLLQAI